MSCLFVSMSKFFNEDHVNIRHKICNYLESDNIIIEGMNTKDVLEIGQFDPEAVITAVYFDGERVAVYAKRFCIDTSTLNSRFEFVNGHKNSELLYFSMHPEPKIKYSFTDKKGNTIENELDFKTMDVMGRHAVGNKISDQKISSITDISPEITEEEEIVENETMWKEERDEPELKTTQGQDLRSIGITPAGLESDIATGEELAGAEIGAEAGAPQAGAAPATNAPIAGTPAGAGAPAGVPGL